MVNSTAVQQMAKPSIMQSLKKGIHYEEIDVSLIIVVNCIRVSDAMTSLPLFLCEHGHPHSASGEIILVWVQWLLG